MTCKQCGADFHETSESDGLCFSCLRLREAPDALSKRTSFLGKPFTDLKQVEEDDRIKKIAEILSQNPGKKIGVIVDSGDLHLGKADRYISKLQSTLPSVKLHNRFSGPAPGSETLIFIL